MRLLPPEVVAAIDDLELSSRLVVEGLRTGGHRSPFHGFSTEFRQHRPYRAGDDLKHLDWKLYARSDRLYTRQFRETTNLSVMLVVDTSASMGFTAPQESWSKLRHAVVAAAALAHLAIAEGHAVGLMTTAGPDATMVRPRGGRPHLRMLLTQLDALDARGTWDGARALSLGAQLLQRRGLVLLLSDLYDDEAGVLREIRHVARHGHDVALLHVLSGGELELPGTSAIEFEDSETAQRRMADVDAVRAEYAAAVGGFLERWRRETAHAGVDYALLRTDAPPQVGLREFLRRRGATRGGDARRTGDAPR